MARKVYARQIAPEHQESPLFLGDEFFPDDIILDGNRDYKSHMTPEYEKLMKYFDNDAWDYEHSENCNLADFLRLYRYDRPDGQPWTREQRKQWDRLFRYGDMSDDSDLLEALELLTGKEWTSGSIRGCCQGDWQTIYYPVEEWTREALEWFEIEYFNTGEEWIIHDGNSEPEDAEEISGYCIYTHAWNDDGIKREIADAEGVEPEDVVLYRFTGWARTAKYEIA